MQPSSLQVSWFDDTKSYTTDVMICTALFENETCPITRDQIDLPFVVKVNSEKQEILDTGLDPSLNAVALTCGHRFNLGALIYHWMYTKMRCPLCNAGMDSKLSINNFKTKSIQNLSVQLHDKQKLDVLHELLQEQMDVRQVATNDFVNLLIDSALNRPDLIDMHRLTVTENTSTANTFTTLPIPTARNLHRQTTNSESNVDNALNQILQMRTSPTTTVIYHVFTIVYLFLDSSVMSMLLPTSLEKTRFRVQKASIRSLNQSLHQWKPTHMNLVTYMVDFLGTQTVIARSDKICLDPNEIYTSKMFKDNDSKHDSFHLIDWMCQFVPNNRYEIHNIECASSQCRNVIVCTRS